MIIPLDRWHECGIQVGNGSAIEAALTETDERVALDVHAGEGYERNLKRFEMTDDDIILKPGECVRIDVRETLHTPDGVMGLVVSRASLAADGLFVASLKIDPNFSGHLKLPVVNGSRHSIRVPPRAPFASLVFFRLTEPPASAPKRVPSPSRGIVKRSLQARLAVAAPYIATGAVTLAVQAVVKGVFG